MPDIVTNVLYQDIDRLQEEEGEMRELIGFIFFLGGLIWLALIWWPLWIVYMVIIGFSLLDD